MRSLARTLIAVGVVVGALAPAAEGKRAVPQGFVGVMADGPVTHGERDLVAELRPMVRIGVESVRVVFEWRRIQPYRSWLQVPPAELASYEDVDGVPTDFRLTDRWVGAAAARGVGILPVLISPPPWAARHPGEPNSPPASPAEYARFARALVERYGSMGAYWSERPGAARLPIRDWQIWNEPHFFGFWRPGSEGWAREYVALLERAHAAIRKADPHARVVLAGLANRSWKHLARIYSEGARPSFDAVAIHPFTKRVEGVVTILERARAVMKQRGDASLPLLVTELSWPSAKGKTDVRYGIERDEQGQARQLRNAYRKLAANRERLRLRAAYWYTWMTRDRSRKEPFDYAGLSKLRDGEPVRKPAYGAMREFALALEGCAAKESTALACAH